MSRPDPDIALAAERLASGDPARWSAVLAAPVAARPVLIALGALNLDLARAPWASAEPMVAEMRLQWWVDALEIAGASGKPLPHEIGPAVQMALTAGAPLADLVAAAEARRWDCWKEPFEDEAAFDAYLAATAGGMIWASARALGADPAAEPIAREAGWAFGLANLFLAIPELEARGRYPVVDGRASALADLVAAAEARRWDCWKEPFEDDAAFDAYLAATAGGMIWASARALGADPAAEPIAREAGWAFGLANLFLAIPELEARGRYPVVDGRASALADLALRGLAQLDSAKAGRARLSSATRKALDPALLQGWQARAILTQAKNEPDRIAAGALELSEFRRRAGLLRAAYLGAI